MEKNFFFVIILVLHFLNVESQTGDSSEVILGQEKYKKEVIQIVKEYSRIIDSLRNDMLDKMSKDSLYSEKEMKTRPKKYRGYDGGIIGYTMKEEDQKIMEIINRFLKIDRITGSSRTKNNNGQVEYRFYYIRTQKEIDGKRVAIKGEVVWVDN